MNQHESIWIADTSSEYQSYPKLKSNIEIDLAIIGGGITGISAAYFLRNSGLKIAVLEAKEVASLTSGYTTAKVTAFHDLKYSFLEKKMGSENARIYAHSNQWAIEEYERVIQKEKIDCQWQRKSVFAFARTEKGLEEIKEELKAARKAGLNVEFLEKDSDLPFDIKGKIKFSNQAMFHPRKFILSLAEIVSKKGIVIYENTRITEIKEKEDLCHIVSEDQNIIVAKDVVIASNYPIYDKGLFFLRMSQMRSYALAGKINGKMIEDMYVGVDAENITVRPYSNKSGEWLIIGGEDHYTGIMKENPFLKLEEKSKEMFNIKSIDYYWAAQDSSPVDRVPFIGKMPRSENIYVATGFGEWGMTTGFVAAKIVSDFLEGRENDWKKLYSPSRIKPLASAGNVGNTATHVIKGFGSYATKSKKLNFSNLERGKGMVMAHVGEKIAAYKDDHEKIHALSAKCSHMGCIVEFNEAEKSWDCPCHGSRFDVDGNVLNSPAVNKLPKEIIKE